MNRNVALLLVLCALSAALVGAQGKARIAGYGVWTAPGSGSAVTATITMTAPDLQSVENVQETIVAGLGKALGGLDGYVLVTLQTDDPVAIDLREFPLESLKRILRSKGYAGIPTHGVYLNFPYLSAIEGLQSFDANKLTIRMHWPEKTAGTSTRPFYFDSRSRVMVLPELSKPTLVAVPDYTGLSFVKAPDKSDATFTLASWFAGDPCCGW